MSEEERQGASETSGEARREDRERDSEPKTLAVSSPISSPMMPLHDESGEPQTAVADAHVLRAMIAKVQEDTARHPPRDEGGAPPTTTPTPQDDAGSEATTLPPPAKTPMSPGVAQASPVVDKLPSLDEPLDRSSELPTEVRPQAEDSTPGMGAATDETDDGWPNDDDDDRAERTVATESPDMLAEHTGETSVPSLEMARKLMQERLEAEGSSRRVPAAPITAPVLENPPQSARVSLPGAEDDIDPYEATIARPPEAMAPGSDRQPAPHGYPETMASPQHPAPSPLAATGYQAPQQPAASPLAHTGYAPPQAHPHAQVNPQARTQPLQQNNSAHLPQPRPMPMQETQPLAFSPMGGQVQQGQQGPQHGPYPGAFPPVPGGQHPGMQHDPRQLGPPQSQSQPGYPAMPIMQSPRAPQGLTANRVQLIVIAACVVIAAVGITLITVALRR